MRAVAKSDMTDSANSAQCAPPSVRQARSPSARSVRRGYGGGARAQGIGYNMRAVCRLRARIARRKGREVLRDYPDLEKPSQGGRGGVGGFERLERETGRKAETLAKWVKLFIEHQDEEASYGKKLRVLPRSLARGCFAPAILR